MTDLIKILFVFALILGLLRVRLHLGVVMLLAAGVLGGLMRMAPLAIGEAALGGLADPAAVSLMVALALIMVLEAVLRQTGALTNLVESLRGLFGDNRVVMALMPAIIGILPSAGGARFSAPMVEESAAGCAIAGDRKSFINYWFRHIWEYVSPLYPGFIMLAAMTRVPMGTLFLAMAPFTLTVLGAGLFYGFRDIEPIAHDAESNRREDIRKALLALSPIVAVMVLVMVLQIDIALSLLAVTGLLLAIHRYRPRRVWQTVRSSISWKTLLLVLGVLVFKGVMEESGSVDNLPRLFESLGVPVAAVLFALPFLVGLLTGITIAYVGITFPLLLPLMGAGEPNLGMLAFAFAAGFAGVMFSPVHLCLVLTRDYFKADLSPIYRTMLVPEALVMLVATAELLLLGKGVFG